MSAAARNQSVNQTTPFFFFFFFFRNMYHTQQDTHVQGLLFIISHALRTIVTTTTRRRPSGASSRLYARARAKAAPLRICHRRPSPSGRIPFHSINKTTEKNVIPCTIHPWTARGDASKRALRTVYTARSAAPSPQITTSSTVHNSSRWGSRVGWMDG